MSERCARVTELSALEIVLNNNNNSHFSEYVYT